MATAEMPRFKPKGVLERNPSDDLWKHTLSRIPTIYGRLSYMASLRDTNSGIYRHHGLSAMFGREGSNNALREGHVRVFEEWINLPLSEKHADLMRYLAELEDPSSIVLDHWIGEGACRFLIPGATREAEAELFVRELEALVQTIRNGLREAETSPHSSPPT